MFKKHPDNDKITINIMDRGVNDGREKENIRIHNEADKTEMDETEMAGKIKRSRYKKCA